MHSNVPDASRYVTQTCKRVVADVGLIKEDAEDGEEEILDDEGLPEWAQRAALIEDKISTYFFLTLYPQFLISFYTSSIGRAHALLFFFLQMIIQITPSSLTCQISVISCRYQADRSGSSCIQVTLTNCSRRIQLCNALV